MLAVAYRARLNIFSRHPRRRSAKSQGYRRFRAASLALYLRVIVARVYLRYGWRWYAKRLRDGRELKTRCHGSNFKRKCVTWTFYRARVLLQLRLKFRAASVCIVIITRRNRPGVIKYENTVCLMQILFNFSSKKYHCEFTQFRRENMENIIEPTTIRSCLINKKNSVFFHS